MKAVNCFFFLVLISILPGCKKSKDTFPLNPCSDYNATTAQFTIEEEYYGRFFESDTVICNSDVYFRASQKGNGYSYEWQIDNYNETFQSKAFTLFFENPVTVHVRLIVKRLKDEKCGFADDGVDTVYKTLVVIQSYPSHPGSPYPAFVGSFKGHYSTSPNEETIINIQPVYHHSTVSDSLIGISHYPSENCNDQQFLEYFWNHCYRAVRLGQGGSVIVGSCINTTDAWAVVDTSGNYLRIDFKKVDASGNITPVYFAGVRQ